MTVNQIKGLLNQQRLNIPDQRPIKTRLAVKDMYRNPVSLQLLTEHAHVTVNTRYGTFEFFRIKVTDQLPDYLLSTANTHFVGQMQYAFFLVQFCHSANALTHVVLPPDFKSQQTPEFLRIVDIARLMTIPDSTDACRIEIV